MNGTAPTTGAVNERISVTLDSRCYTFPGLETEPEVVQQLVDAALRTPGVTSAIALRVGGEYGVEVKKIPTLDWSAVRPQLLEAFRVQLGLVTLIVQVRVFHPDPFRHGWEDDFPEGEED